MALPRDRVTQLAQALGVALDWNTVAAPSGAKGRRPTNLDPTSMAKISADPLLRALAALGMILNGPRPSPMGATYDIECPWINDHTQRARSGTVYVPVRTKFKCLHDHCTHKHHGDLYQAICEKLREDSFGLQTMAHYEFDAVDPSTFPLPSLPDPEADWIRDTVYLAKEHRQNFWSISRHERHHDDAHNVVWAQRLAHVLPETPASTPTKPKYYTPAQWYRRHRRRRLAHGFIHWPGGDVLVQREGKTLCNLWQETRPHSTSAPVSDDQVKPWTDLTHHVLGVETLDAMQDTELVKDWLAMVSSTWVKPGWFPLVIGPQGLGKDAITLPVRRGLGSMATEIAGAEIGGLFNSWAMRRFIAVNELRQTTRGGLTPHDQMNALKLWDNTRETVVINAKFQQPYDARNVFALWITSNERMPVRLEKDDRRFMVFDRHDEPVRHDLIQAYLTWLDEEQDDGRKGWELVFAWLGQRWDTMDDYRRNALTGHAPGSPAKQALIQASQDEVQAWVQGCIDAEPPAPEAWPDIISSAYVHKRMTQAVRNGDGLSTRTVVPSVDRIGRLLGDLGCKNLNNGQPVYVLGKLIRLWACRDHALYVPLKPTELSKVVEKMVGGTGLGDFTA